MKKSTLFSFFIISTLFFTACKEKPTSNIKANHDSSSAKVELPVALSNPDNRASCVFLTADQEGLPYVSWVEIDSLKEKHFYFARFDGEKGKFGTKQIIPIQQNAAIHEEGMPKIAIKGNGDLFALYEISIPVEGSRFGLGDLRYVQSKDGGKTWSEPRSVDSEDLAQNKSGNFSNISRLKDGEIGIAWLGSDPKSKYDARPIKFSKTRPDGSMEKSRIVNYQGCQCCRTALASDANGATFIAFRDLLENNIRDISFLRLEPDGTLADPAHSFSNDQWQVEGCPHNGPSIALNGNQINVTWFTNGENHLGVNFASLNPDGKMLEYHHLSEKGQFVQNSFMPDGTPIIAYNESYRKSDAVYSRIIVNKITGNTIYQKEITPPQVEAFYPMIHSLDADRIMVTWSGAQKVYYRIIDANSLQMTQVTADKMLSGNL